MRGKSVTTWLVSFVAVVVGIIIVLAASRARSAELPAVTKSAADAAIRGETEEAMGLIERALAADRINAEALFVRACIRLQSGDLSGAVEDSNRLESSRGPLQEIRIIRELAVARGQTPASEWMPAFLAALKKIGANGLEQSLLRFTPTSRRPLSPEMLARVAGGDGFLVRAAEAGESIPSTLVNEAEQMLAAQQPLVVLLAAVSVLNNSHVAEADKPKATAAAKALIAKLARENPREMYLQVWALLSETPESSPLAEPDVARLERIIFSTQTSLPLSLVYEATRSAYAKVDPPQASEAAFTATVAFYPPQFHVVLMRRTKPMLESGDPALRRRTGLAIAQLGRAVMNQASLLDLSIGSMLLGRAAALAGDDLAGEADRRRKEFQTMLKASDRLKFAAEWPIAGLMRELTERKIHEELSLIREMP
jgi:hypothetical protein